MSNWRTKHIDLGDIEVGKKQVLTFYYKKQLQSVVSLTSSCGCSKPVQKNNSIVVTFTPKPIPKHLISQGWYKTTKRVNVRFADGTEDVLSFISTIHKK